MLSLVVSHRLSELTARVHFTDEYQARNLPEAGRSSRQSSRRWFRFLWTGSIYTSGACMLATLSVVSSTRTQLLLTSTTGRRGAAGGREGWTDSLPPPGWDGPPRRVRARRLAQRPLAAVPRSVRAWVTAGCRFTAEKLHLASRCRETWQVRENPQNVDENRFVPGPCVCYREALTGAEQLLCQCRYWSRVPFTVETFLPRPLLGPLSRLQPSCDGRREAAVKDGNVPQVSGTHLKQAVPS